MSPRPRRPRAEPTLVALALGLALLGARTATGEALTTVDECPGQGKLEIVFKVDCEHVRGADDKSLCRPFLENQACKLFPAYRKITGINLASECRDITYRLYDHDEWPHQGGDAGGYAGRCSIELMTDFSVRMKSALGPYDTHELLHLYHGPLGALPATHALFGPAQLEAKRLIGDREGFETGFARLKQEFQGPKFERRYAEHRVAEKDACPLAEAAEEARLYIADTKNVYAFYRTLERGTGREQPEREARFNRMYDRVSKGSARQYLLAHGCAAF